MTTGQGNPNVQAAFRDESARYNLSSQFFQEHTPNQDLAFVNLSSSPGQDEEKRRLVRSHAQRGAHQQKQTQRYNNLQIQRAILPMHGSIPPVSQTIPAFDTSGMVVLPQQDGVQPDYGEDYEDLKLYPRTNSAPSSSERNYTSMVFDSQYSLTGNINIDLSLFSQAQSIEPTSPNNGRLDPFHTLPFIPNGREQILMYHYNQVLVNSMLSVAVDPEAKWFGYSVTDPALFHTTMLHSAAHHSFLDRNINAAEFLVLKWDAIRMINSRLDDPLLRISDTTIGAVVALLLFENQEANFESSNIHMNGVHQMVRLRGGLQNLGIAGILRRKILWADLCNSMFSHSKPRFHNLLPRAAGTETGTSSMLTLSSRIQTYMTQLKEILTSLRLLSHALSGGFSRNVVVDEIYSLEHRVVVLLAETNPEAISDLNSNLDPDDDNSYLNHRLTMYQIMLATQIYIYLFLRDHFVPVPIFSVLVSRLSNSLYPPESGSKLQGTWQESDRYDRQNGLLLWMLLLGTLAAEGRESRSRFLASFKTLCNVLGLTTLTEVVDNAKKIAWIERKVDKTLLKLWNETQDDV